MCACEIPAAVRALRRNSRTTPRPGTRQSGAVDDLNSERSYRSMAAHMNTVAGNEALVLDADKRYPQLACFAGTLRHRVIEWMIGAVGESADAARLAPLLFSVELEGHSSAMFDRKGDASLPTPAPTEPYLQRFITASEALVERADVRLASSKVATQ